MFALILGGSASGKSEYAEQHVLSRPGRRIYLATMAAWDEESLRRIQKHRLARAGRDFETVEAPDSLWKIDLPAESNVLLEDLDNLFANEYFGENGGGADSVLRGIEHILTHCADLTVVAGELFSGGCEYLDDTVPYLRALAGAERQLAAKADMVVEVVCGLPNRIR